LAAAPIGNGAHAEREEPDQEGEGEAGNERDGDIGFWSPPQKTWISCSVTKGRPS